MVAQLVASMSCVGVVEVVGSSLARGHIFTASIGSVALLYTSVFIKYVNLHQPLILCYVRVMFVNYLLF